MRGRSHGGGFFFFKTPSNDGATGEEAMNTFRKANPAKSVMFVVDYDDARRAYLWVDNPAKATDPRSVGMIARAQQEQGTLPGGSITSIRRVR
jgi:hypothetical protein